MTIQTKIYRTGNKYFWQLSVIFKTGREYFYKSELFGTKKEAAESLEEFKKKQKIKAEFIGRTKNLNNSERSF